MTKRLSRLQRFGFLMLLVVVASLGLAACGDKTATSAATTAPATTGGATVTPVNQGGETKSLGGGGVRSWVQLDNKGKPEALGVTLTEAALTNLPDAPSETVLNLPKQDYGLAFNHISVDWNPQGHEPQGIYDKPHFDFHFYLISQDERKQILPTDGISAKQPSTEALPADYVSPAPVAVPGMGVHWADKTSPELNGQPFTTTLLYGYAKGNMAFIEPMITKALLESKPNQTFDLKLPSVYPKKGVYYPTKYNIKYNAASHEISVALEGLTLR